jgi:hypothetical protein
MRVPCDLCITQRDNICRLSFRSAERANDCGGAMACLREAGAARTMARRGSNVSKPG